MSLNPVMPGDRVKRTYVLLTEEGMPEVTEYGEVAERHFGTGSHSMVTVKWDDGTKDCTFDSGIYPIDLETSHPEPLAYRNPIHPSGSRVLLGKQVPEWSTSLADYRMRVRELEAELAARPWR